MYSVTPTSSSTFEEKIVLFDPRNRYLKSVIDSLPSFWLWLWLSSYSTVIRLQLSPTIQDAMLQLYSKCHITWHVCADRFPLCERNLRRQWPLEPPRRAEPSRCCPVPATRVLFSSSLQNATSQPRERKKILNKNADYWRRTKSVDVVVVAVVVVVVIVASHVVLLTTTNLQLEFWFWELERAKLFELFEDSRNWSWAIHYILKILKFELLVFV